MSFRQYDIALQKTRAQEIKVRDYREKLNLAQGELPGEKKKALNQLSQTRDYLRKVKQYRKRELAQHKDIDRQVKGQEKKILDAAKDLARQAGEARLNLNKYRHVAFEQKKHSLYTYHMAVEKWWEQAFESIKKLRESKHIDAYIMRASKAMQKALMGVPTSVGQMSLVWQRQYDFKWRDWLDVRDQRRAAVMPVQEPPSTRSMEKADEQIVKLNKTGYKQEAKIREHENKLKYAMASLDTRAKGAHTKVDAAVAERGKQIIKGRKQEAALIKHIKYLEERGDKLASEQDRMGTAAGQLANQRARIATAKARALAAVRMRNAMRPRYEAQLRAFQQAYAAAKKAGKPLPRPPRLPAWFLKEKGLIK